MSGVSGNEVFRGPGCALHGWCLSGTLAMQSANSTIGESLAFKWCFCHTDINYAWSVDEVFLGPGCALATLRGWCLSGTLALQCAGCATGQSLGATSTP